jgi:hypothetical protein
MEFKVMAKKATHPSQEEVRITSIAIKADKVVIGIQTSDGDATTASLLKCPNPPLPDFEEAYRKMGTMICKLMDMPDAWRSAHKLNKVEIKYEKDDGRLGLVGTIFVHLSKFSGGSAVNSPYQRERVQGGGGGDAFMPEAMCEHLKELIKLARAYYKGDRAQGSLLQSGGDEDEDDAPPADEDK